MAKGIYINPTTFVPLDQISKDLTAEIASRNFAMGSYAGFFNYLPDPDPILRKLGQDQTVYKDLLADDQAGPLFNRRKNLTKSLDWFIEKNDAGDAEVELCEKTLRVLEGNGCKVKDIIDQTLNPIGFGYSVFEINYGFIDGKWLPVKAWEKPREWFLFDTDNQLRFRSIHDPMGTVIIGPEADPKIAVKFILLQNQPTYENPYGDKALSRCFWPVNFKRGGMRFFSIFIEKYGMPYLFGKLPRGAKPEEHADLLSKLHNMVQDAVGTGPDDSSLQLIETKGTQSADLYDKYLQRCDNSISKAILLNALSTDIQQSGARAASETGAETIEGDIGQTDRDFPVAFFNELFKRVIDLNLGTGKYPTFGVNEIEESKKEFAERDKTISEAFSTSGQKIKRTKNFLINRYNYNEEEFEIVEEVGSFNGSLGGGTDALGKPPLAIQQLALAMARAREAGNEKLAKEIENRMGNLLGGINRTEPAVEPQPIEMSKWKKFLKKVLNIEFQSSPSLREGAGGWADALPDKLLQFQMEEVLQPVIELAKKSNSFEEFNKNLAAQFPTMNSQQLENLAAKVFFIAEIEGRLDAEK